LLSQRPYIEKIYFKASLPDTQGSSDPDIVTPFLFLIRGWIAVVSSSLELRLRQRVYCGEM